MLSKDQIKKNVISEIENVISGLNVESNKIEFKGKWFDLKDKFGISEFLKDCTAIVNTVGLDGLIIIGFDIKQLEFHDSIFSDSNLKDPIELQGIINKNIAFPFPLDTFDGCGSIVMYENRNLWSYP